MSRLESGSEARNVREMKWRRREKPASRAAALRRVALETLERRELLATLPTPLISSAENLIGRGGTATANAYTPSVAVDPINPNKMVAAWTVADPNSGSQVTNFVQAAFSTNGGASWSTLSGLNQVNSQINFSVSQANGAVLFAQTTDPTVAIGRDENVYLLTSTHDAANANGVINLLRYSFTSNTPTASRFDPADQNSLRKAVYAWNGSDAASTPTLAVDTNLPSYTDPSDSSYTITDPFANNVYVAWASTDTPPANAVNFNPNSIKFIASANLGAKFTSPVFVDDVSRFSNHTSQLTRYVAPAIAISQGNPTTGVQGGLVSIVYDDYGSGSTAAIPFDRIVDQVDRFGGTDFNFTSVDPNAQVGATTAPVQLAAAAPFTFTRTVDVAFGSSFTSLANLAVTLGIQYPNLAELTVTLRAPASAGGQTFTLFSSANNVKLSGANLGATTGGGFRNSPLTTFNATAIRSIYNTASTTPYLGTFVPDSDSNGNVGLGGLVGRSSTQLAGQWTLTISSNGTQTSFNPAAVLQAFSLDFSVGATVGFAPTPANPQGTEVTIANNQTFVSAGGGILANSTGVSGSPSRTTVAPVQPGSITPSPVIASDNTLGPFSAFAGRLYVAYTGRFDGLNGIPRTQTDIILLSSDDGGQSWGNATLLNDDDSASDGHTQSVPGSTVGRTQLQPQLAVDQYTGTLVASFLDARDDAANSRVATYIAISGDGGATFSPQTYANSSKTTIDGITGQAVNLGPVPDNQSAGNPNRNAANGFGIHQALAVANGRIVPVWAANANAGSAVSYVPLSIVSSVLTTAAGPRIVASTQGPVGLAGDVVNTTRAADGTTLANAFRITFDRPIDVTTVATTNFAVYFLAPTGGTQVSLPIVAVTAVDPDATTGTATTFNVTFNPASLASPVGTYSYVVLPGSITDRIRYVAGATQTTANTTLGNTIDQNYDAIHGEAPAFQIATNSTATALNPTGTVNSTLAGPSGLQAGERVSAGFLTLNITNASSIATGQNVGDLTIRLIGPGGQAFTVPINGNSDGTFPTTLSGSFLLPASFLASSLVGTFTLRVINNTTGDVGTINSWGLNLRPASFTGDAYVVGQPVGYASYIGGTLPLIVGGPRIVSSRVVDPTTNAVISTGTDNLVRDNTVRAIQVTFDRNVLIGSFTPAQILAIYGPAGAIGLANVTITPVSMFTAGNSTAISDGTSANVFNITFGTTATAQKLSGTYSVTVGSGVRAADGSFADGNANAGLFALQQTSNTGATTTRTYSYSPTVGVSLTAQATTSTTIFVADNFPVQGITAAGVAGLQVRLNIDNVANSPILSAFLVAPDGSRLALFGNLGGGAQGLVNTTLADTAGTPINSSSSIANGAILTPVQPLSDFATLFRSSTGGTWTLQLVNGSTTAARLNSWSLIFQQPVSGTGLGQTVADQETVTFRIFNDSPTNAAANNTWTAIGPAGVTTSTTAAGTFAGAVSSVAVDPSDPTGNTVFVASASGGIWKTTNFLTPSTAGPTYQPLTDFGPNFGLNVGSIAAVARNSDPKQTLVLAGTGFAQGTYAQSSGAVGGTTYPNIDGSAGRGVGFLRSFDGGVTWTLLDSLTNVDASGNQLPIGSAGRDHNFVGDTVYKVLVDPTVQTTGANAGKYVMYAAVGGPTGGLYRSFDSGDHWTKLTGAGTGNAAATDIVFDLVGRSASGNILNVIVAFQGFGVYSSTNQGNTLTLVAGGQGRNNNVTGSTGFPQTVTTVGNAGVTPNGANGRIVLAKPALTTSTSQNIAYQGWIYAAVANANGSFNGLYITKDGGANWTKVNLATVATTNQNLITLAIPTNDNTAGSFDPTANNPARGFARNGNYNLTMTVDPTNPNIVYLGGTQDFQASGLIRIDLTNLYDSQNLTSFANNRNDGGRLTVESTGAISVFNPTQNTNGVLYPATSLGATPYLNFRYAPNVPGASGSGPFNTNTTLRVANTVSSNGGGVDFTNDGSGVLWSLFDEPLKANPTDATGSTNLHASIAFIDPTTGLVRMIFGDDQGVFTALVNVDGSLSSGIGSAVAPNYSRNGNLQNQQFYYGAAQPSNLAAQAAGALLYASGRGLLAVQSDPNLLDNGNITWDNSAVLNPPTTSPRSTPNNAAINSSDRGGVGIATDQTAGNSATNVTATVYEYDVPSLGGNITDFFRVNGVGQTTGLLGNFAQEFPFGNAQASGTTGNDPGGAVANSEIPLGNFAVNPINGNDVLIGSSQGRLYQTTTRGQVWVPIGQPTDFDGTQLSALAYAAPDSTVNNNGQTNQFIYVGTAGRVGGQGHIYVTRTGGTVWTDISAGLDGSSVKAIYPSPNRYDGTATSNGHAAYAVTLNGVFYNADTTVAGTTWVNITGNLAAITRNAFGNGLYSQAAFSTFVQNTGAADQGTAQYGGFSSIVADYRYAIPNAAGTATFPVLYVSGYGGVFRSIDNGTTWTLFPNVALDGAPVDGGYLPSVNVTHLEFSLGAIDPTTGHPTQVAGDRELLLATTYGRGVFAIGLAPTVFTSTLALLPSTATGTANGNPLLTSNKTPTITGLSEISAFGNTVTIKLIDQATGKVIGTGTTDANGRFAVAIVNDGSDPSFFNTDGVKLVGVQATDGSGASGNVAVFQYTLDSTAPAPPTSLRLTAASDTGRSNSDGVTNLAAPGFVAPVFTVSSTEPTTSTLQLLRFNPATNTFDVVGTSPGGTSPVAITDTTIYADVNAGRATLNRVYTYEVRQIDQAGNIGAASTTINVTVNTITPPTLPTPTLAPASNSGLDKTQNVTNARNPTFNVSGLAGSSYQVFLFRSIGGSTPQIVGIAAVGASQVTDTAGVATDGVYLYQVLQQDLAGNNSALSTGLGVTISTAAPAAPTISLFAADATGAPTNPNVTNRNTPRFTGTGTPNLPLALFYFPSPTATSGVQVGATTVTANGTYLIQVNNPLPDGTYYFRTLITNAAGNTALSPALTITIKANPPQVVPTLSIVAADDTGLKGDGVTANRRPRFTGRTDPGVTVNIYSVTNGQLNGPLASATSSTVNGSFTIQLPFNLTNGTTQLVAQATDNAGNRGALSSPVSFRIVTVVGDYFDTGAAQLAIFVPSSQSYAIRNAGVTQVDTTSGRDVPVQYDYNNDGSTDLVAYRYNAAEYYGLLSTGGIYDQPYGTPGQVLPVSGYYGTGGTFVLGAYVPSSGFWYLNTANAGGTVVPFGIANLDVPTPAAFDGNGETEIAVFRPTAADGSGTDGDSFTVYRPNNGSYRVGFNTPAVQRQGFTYQPGDIPAPADYDGVGRDEFAIYRPSTGQFFILNTPDRFNSATWTLRTVTLNLPGGPNVNDVPASQDYDGNGRIDPTVYRPSNSTFYLIHTSTGIQENIAFGPAGQSIAAGGPLLYRLSALTGAFSTRAGYPAGAGGAVGSGSGSVRAASLPAGVGAATTSVALAAAPASTASTVAIVTPLVVATSPTTSSVPMSSGGTTATVGHPAQSRKAAGQHVVAVGKAVHKVKVSTATPKSAAGKAGHGAKVAAKPANAHAAHQRASKAALAAKAAAHLATSAGRTHAATQASTQAAATPLDQAVVALALQHLAALGKAKHKS